MPSVGCWGSSNDLSSDSSRASFISDLKSDINSSNGVWKGGVLIRVSRSFLRESRNLTRFYRYSEYNFLSQSASVFKILANSTSRVAVKSRIPSTFSLIPQRILVKSRIPEMPASILYSNLVPSVTIQVKPSEQYNLVVPLTTLYKVVLAFE